MINVKKRYKKIFFPFLISFLTFSLGSFLYFNWVKTNSNNKIYEIVYFDLGAPESFDPLDADSFDNMARARMLFATPIEVNEQSHLSSRVLKSFSYNPDLREIEFVLRENLFFSNGQSLEVEDVLLAIKRMLLARPSFPVLKHILGKDEWSKSTYPLKINPSGITVGKNTIKIKLRSQVSNPLFRFALELFSIIPRDCINLEKNILIKTPPSSGSYIVVSSSAQEILFQLREDPCVVHLSNKMPDKIKFRYVAPQDPGRSDFVLNDHAVLTGMDYRLDFEGIASLREKLHFKFLPSTSFKTVILNPNIPPFDNPNYRRQFANELRQTYNSYPNHTYQVSPSIFSQILPGFRENTFFEEVQKNIENHDGEKTLNWSKYEIPWTPSSSSVSMFDNNAIFKTILRLGLKVRIGTSLPSSQKIQSYYESNQTAFHVFRSGFWAQDAIGDTQMIFTPNMHPQLIFVNKNLELQAAVNNLDRIKPEDVDSAMSEVNKAIYKDSIMVPILLSRIFFASKKSSLLAELPQSVVHPAPWQIFNLDENGK